MHRIVPKKFYYRDPAVVARELIGKLLVRDFNGRRLSCMVTETEAYYGEWDPASRARRGGDLRRVMYGEPGVALVYGIHRQWLLNIVAHEEGSGGAVLIRSCMPVEGADLMMKLRGACRQVDLTRGPGRLTRALCIDKSFHKKPVYKRDAGLWVEYYESWRKFSIARSHRIGVSEDLEKPLRFYVRDSKYVTRR